ncbi:hypothetical protein Tco_0983851 [Tanacetum coccineum]
MTFMDNGIQMDLWLPKKEMSSPLSKSLPRESERHLLIPDMESYPVSSEVQAQICRIFLDGYIGSDSIGGGDGVLKVKSSGVIGERVRVMSIAIDDEEVSLMDGVLDGAFDAFGDRGCCFGEGVLSSACVRSMNNFLGGIIVILGFLESLEVEA